MLVNAAPDSSQPGSNPAALVALSLFVPSVYLSGEAFHTSYQFDHLNKPTLGVITTWQTKHGIFSCLVKYYRVLIETTDWLSTAAAAVYQTLPVFIQHR